MVDHPDQLNVICLRKFTSLLKSDQLLWKKQIEQQVEKLYRQKTTRSDDQQKHKYNRAELFRIENESSKNDISNVIATLPQTSFLEYFLRGFCPLNSILSEHLMNYLVTYDQLNDFTFSLFSSHVTCLRRLVINIKYLSRLQCHILNQHPNLTELEIIFRDSPSNRTINMTNDNFYQAVCPSFYSKFEDICTIYAPFILHRKYSRSSVDFRRMSTTDNSSDEFSHQKLLNGIFSNLHPVTIERLKILSLSHYKFFVPSHSTPARKYSMADMSPLTKCLINPSSTPINSVPINLRLLLKFTNLTTLNLSATDIKNPCLDIIINALENLDTFDLSSCRSITVFHSLLKLSSKLKWLNLYNCCFEMQQNPTIYHILYQLQYLEYLDLSNDTTLNDNTHPIIGNDSDINRFLNQPNCLPRLKHFDISGQRIVSSICLQRFLLNHRNLQFLGLFLTREIYSQCIFDQNDLCYSKFRHYTYDYYPMSIENDLSAGEPFLIEALTRYRDRAGFVHKILHSIFPLTRSFQLKEQNLLLDLILQVMSIHSTVQAVQMAATACLYNLTRSPIIEQIHAKYLAQIVQATLNVMQQYPKQQQLHKNCLLTLCSDRMLHEPHFNFYLLAILVMHNLQAYTDLAIIQPGVAILSLLTTRLTIDECTRLASLKNLKRLLQIVEQQIDRLQTIQQNQNQPVINAHNDQTEQSSNDIDVALNNPQQLTSDDTLRFCLSLLWNLTDENDIVCENFIQSMGLELFQRLLHLFASDTIVLTKIVGLLSNIAEVAQLKAYLYSNDIIPVMQKFINESILDVAFSSTGILAHLLHEQSDEEINLELCQQMNDAIKSWQNPHTNMVTYRSFKPFLPLLCCTRIPVVQLWALWAIHHVCSTDHNRYIRIIRAEKIYQVMQSLYDDEISVDHPDAFKLHLLKSLLELLKPDHLNLHQNTSADAS